MTIYETLPVVAGSIGPAVAVANMSAQKTLIVAGLQGIISIEARAVGATSFVQIANFSANGQKIVSVAAGELRVRANNGSASAVQVIAEQSFIRTGTVPTPPSNGPGASLDVSAFGPFTTIYVGGKTGAGSVSIQISPNGVSWAEAFTFPSNGLSTKEIAARFVRAVGNGATAVVTVASDIGDGTGADPSLSAPSLTFVYSPGNSGGARGNIYIDWAQLVATMSSVEGAKILQFDDSFITPIVLPAGLWDMLDVAWMGSPNVAVAPVVELPEGCVFTNLRAFSGPLTVKCTATATSPISDFVNGDLYQIGVVWSNRTLRFQNTGSVALFDMSAMGAGEEVEFGLRSVFFGEMSDTAPVVAANGTGGNLLFLLIDRNVVRAVAVATAVGVTWTRRWQSDSAAVANQTGPVLGPVVDDIPGSVFGERSRYWLVPSPPATPAVAPITLNPICYGVFNVSGGGFTQTLPNIVTANLRLFKQGLIIWIKEVSGSPGLRIAPAGGQTINGSANPVSIPPGGLVAFHCDGVSDWRTCEMSRYAPPEIWFDDDVAANQTDVPLDTRASALFAEFKAVSPGSVVGIGSRLTETITAGTLTLAVSINGAAGALSLVHTAGSNPDGGEAFQLPGVDDFVAGDLIGILITTDAGFLPVTTDLEATLELSDV